MASKPALIDLMAANEKLDQLFLDCSELESLAASIMQAADGLDPTVDSGGLTIEHMMSLAFRIEATEQRLISVAQRIADAATTVIKNQCQKALVN